MIDLVINFQGYKVEGGASHWWDVTVGRKLDLLKKIWWAANRAGGGGSRDSSQLAVNWDESSVNCWQPLTLLFSRKKFILF